MVKLSYNDDTRCWRLEVSSTIDKCIKLRQMINYCQDINLLSSDNDVHLAMSRPLIYTVNYSNVIVDFMSYDDSAILLASEIIANVLNMDLTI